MKKIIALLLILTMAMSLFAGCGKKEASNDKTAAVTPSNQTESTDAKTETVDSDPSKWPVVSFPAVPVCEITDEELVEGALNDYLISINAGVLADVVCVEFGNIATTMTLMLSSGEDPIDLFCYNFFSNLSNVVASEQVIPLDDLLASHPGIVEAIGEEYMSLGQINGVQYGLPIVGNFSTMCWYALRKDIAEAIGVADKDGSKITLAELEEIMLAAKAAYPDLVYMPSTGEMLYFGNYDSLGDNFNVGVLPDFGTGDTTLVNYYETEFFEDICHAIKGYEKAGLLLNDPLNQSHDKSHIKNGVAGGAFLGGYDHKTLYDQTVSTYNFDPVLFQLSDLAATCSSSSGLGAYCVAAVSQQPEAAMKMMELLYTDENVMRFVAQGVKDVHYVVDENGCSWYPEGKGMANLGWGSNAQWYFPNQTLTIPFCTNNVNYYQDMLKTNNECLKSQAMGFVFDSLPVNDQQIAVTAVIEQYLDALMYGQVDVDQYLAEFREELKEAGIDDVIAEKQAQLNAFLGK